MEKSKKIISLLLALIMALSIFTIVPFTASAAEAELIGTGEQDGFYNYTILADGSAEITKYFGTDAHAVIPSTLGGHTVTVIGQSAFSGSTDMTSVVIPNTVTKLKLLAFEGCTGLTSINIPDSVTFIDSSVFENCTNLADITLPDTLTYLGTSSFANTKWRNNQPNGIMYLGNYAYGYNYSDWYASVPEELALREGTIGIAEYAFRDSGDYKSLTLPNSLRFIGENAFTGCYNLKNINFGNSVTEIQDFAFYGCTSLRSITIPDSVTRIGRRAFYNCSNLGIINIPDSVVSIGEDAFLFTAWYDGQPEGMVYAGKVAYCYKGYNRPEEIIFNSDTVGIADDAFYYFSGISVLPDSLKHIGAKAFFGCEMKTVEIPETVTGIGEAAFVGNHFDSVMIPKSVTRIGDYAFGYGYAFSSYTKDDDFTIYGYSGTDAERYAKENGFKFIDLESFSGVTLSGSFKSYLNKPGITIELLKNGSQVDSAGYQSDTGSYSFANVPAGSYTLRVSKANHVTRNYAVTVNYQNVNLDVEINPIGDVNLNGVVEMRDYAALYKHVMKSKQLEGYALACADVNGKNGVDMKDYAAVYKHVMKTTPLW